MKLSHTSLIAISGLIAVAMGAAAAHSLSGEHAREMVQQASLYHLIHSAVLLYAADKTGKAAGLSRLFFALGIVLFSMAIYLRYAADIAIPAGVIPAGGVCYMLGWLALAASSIKR
jgi:uncharacterized membrane protein YgdD (TMEM256/DUF423 family)